MFDQVDGRWVAVTLGSDKCRDGPAEVWQVFTLQPASRRHADRRIPRGFRQRLRRKRTVTFTRTGDVDINSLPDPATLPPRVVSPAEALHGRYHISRNVLERDRPTAGRPGRHHRLSAHR